MLFRNITTALYFFVAFNAAVSHGMPCAAHLTAAAANYLEIERLLNTPEAGGFPFRFDTAWGQNLMNLVALHLPVEAEARRTMVESNFGSSFTHDLTYSGSNQKFAHELLHSLAVASLVNKKDEAGTPLLLNALIGAGEPTAPSPLLVETRLELIQILNDPNVGFPLNFASPAVRRLSEIVAARVPVAPDSRSTKVARLFGSALAVTIDFQGSNNVFTHSLLHALSVAEKLKATIPEAAS